MNDTRQLSRRAARLYAGVKTTKEGIEVKIHDQQAALVNVGKHLGMFKDKSRSSNTTHDRGSHPRGRRRRAATHAGDA
jgi:phage terminase small subunit